MSHYHRNFLLIIHWYLLLNCWQLGSCDEVKGRESGTKTHVINFNITGSLNQQNRRIILINGRSDTYGPTIVVNSGDSLNLCVTNSLCNTEQLQIAETDTLWNEYCSTSVHFHGLIPIGISNDGVPGLTQDPIKSGEKYWYNFTIPEETCGTFWYHSHSSVQYGDGLRGLFIIKCDKYDSLKYEIINSLEEMNEIKSNEVLPLLDNVPSAHIDDKIIKEQTITLSDWYHSSQLDILKDQVLTQQGTNDPRLDGSLINGIESSGLTVELDRSTKYLLLRILNSGTSGTQVFHLENHQLIIMETDGSLITPYVIDTLTLAVGQRYTVLVKLQEDGDVPVRGINGCNKMMGYITKNIWFTKDKNNSSFKATKQEAEYDNIRIKHLKGFNNYEVYKEFIPLEETKLWENPIDNIELDYDYFSDSNTVDKYGSGMYKVNGKTIQEYFKTPIKINNSAKDQVVELVINSIDHMRHPWHLHGHNFQLISIGTGGEGPLHLRSEVSMTKALQKYNGDLEYWKSAKRSPVIRDSINIPGNSFAVIRFKTHQTGNWLLHCHVEWHVAKGLGAVLQIEDGNRTTSIIDRPTQDTYNVNEDEGSVDSTKVIVYPHRIPALVIYFLIMCAINAILYRWLSRK
ncbi:hypothetical protein Kpol_2000p90 [Vanderwaltozyma polyspora DSM 70294]|uniref:Uncharacterized protein n=1 Tax=Vanderwaltozyma polyspora (strain ATCC 22028 / DSM 70294 / BCRC 21397 / CBS 2163 / NBRC 10782 / NRRL Y-8283 / UCD 57-17) TaxID=436907 RepID=A7TF97_VANPO|nr:uncharacterized protein Kpol_2000p90 [Vanderwaltozyma polyspora DSM 70294]EDO19122.1 hypothetical protein Kpol_2000p90 [Vanderwaltozyma polyspora DSM 70294]